MENKFEDVGDGHNDKGDSAHHFISYDFFERGFFLSGFLLNLLVRTSDVNVLSRS